jgi:hypothetical protein
VRECKAARLAWKVDAAAPALLLDGKTPDEVADILARRFRCSRQAVIDALNDFSDQEHLRGMATKRAARLYAIQETIEVGALDALRALRGVVNDSEGRPRDRVAAAGALLTAASRAERLKVSAQLSGGWETDGLYRAETLGDYQGSRGREIRARGWKQHGERAAGEQRREELARAVARCLRADEE